MFDSLYIIGAYHFRLYFFARRDFAVTLFHPLFDPTAPYIAISLQVAHPGPPAAQPAPTSPPQVVPSLSLNDDEEPSEASTSFRGSSSGPSNSYTLAKLGTMNGFFSSTSDKRLQPPI